MCQPLDFSSFLNKDIDESWVLHFAKFCKRAENKVYSRRQKKQQYVEYKFEIAIEMESLRKIEKMRIEFFKDEGKRANMEYSCNKSYRK